MADHQRLLHDGGLSAPAGTFSCSQAARKVHDHLAYTGCEVNVCKCDQGLLPSMICTCGLGALTGMVCMGPSLHNFACSRIPIMEP